MEQTGAAFGVFAVSLGKISSQRDLSVSVSKARGIGPIGPLALSDLVLITVTISLICSQKCPQSRSCGLVGGGSWLGACGGWWRPEARLGHGG